MIENAPRLRDVPVPSGETGVWGSDAIAQCLRALGVEYLAINPGASYRGLHDSIVNNLGNVDPQFLLCLHEDAALSIAQGYAKATDRMMGAVVHSNVGLMHGMMSIFNAWCDRVPMLILGATGPWDAAKRRPWIDWIHTVSDQGGLIRNFTKWDNQPASVEAAYEALMRATQIANTAPKGPTYINLDSTLQESKLAALPPLPDIARFAPPAPAVPAPETLRQVADLLSKASNPVILMGRVSRSQEGWDQRIALAEKLNARVITNMKVAASFPTDHPLYAGSGTSGGSLGFSIPDADVILSLDWLDLAGTIAPKFGQDVAAKVIQVSPDVYSHRGWGSEYLALSPADIYVACEPDAAVPVLLETVAQRPGSLPAATPRRDLREGMHVEGIARALNEVAGDADLCLARLPFGWKGEYRTFSGPLDFLGYEGGGGVGAGLGITVGAALALRDTGRLTVGIVGDGDFLMGVTALWTATHYHIPALIIVNNNRSFFNDEQHQERVAITRGRPAENKWIGQRIDDPDIDLAAMARAQGCEATGPITTFDDLKIAIAAGVQAVRNGAVYVIDARVSATSY